MDWSIGKQGSATLRAIVFSMALVLPQLALAQSTSPFLTGATSLQTNILAWLTPVAIILIMVLGAMAMANRMSWGWCIGAILGVAIAFGAPQIVTWIRGMFGV
jgi:type IV secretion system protein VirB2